MAVSSYSKKNLLETVDLLEKAGFRVMAITSDNAAVIRNVTKSLTNDLSRTYMLSKNVEGHKIFIMKDAPHMIKSVRNCKLLVAQRHSKQFKAFIIWRSQVV